jgi:hypothetical protein
MSLIKEELLNVITMIILWLKKGISITWKKGLSLSEERGVIYTIFNIFHIFSVLIRYQIK